MNFSIIDFETATPWRGSVCAVGLTVVRNGEIVDRFYSLINPQEHIHTFNTKIHGISDADVATAPTFAEVWPKIVELVGEYPLGAHNAEFDMAAIQSAVVHWDVQPANFKVFDTLSLFRSAFHCSNGCGLSELTDHYGIKLEHHNAGADSMATAKCLLALVREIKATDLCCLFDRFSSPYPSSILYYLPIPYKEFADRRQKAKAIKEPFIIVHTEEKEVPITCGCDMQGLVICVTGEMEYCSRNQVKELIANHGGKATTSVSGKTNVILVGNYYGYPKGYISNKHQDALDRIAKGQNIEIWHEEEFLLHIKKNED